MYQTIYYQEGSKDVYMTIGENDSGNIKQYGIAIVHTSNKEYGAFIGSKESQ